MTQLLTVKIASPAGTIYEGEVKSLSSTNANGDFDILPQHANFLTVVEKKPIRIIDKNDKKEQFSFDLGIISVTNNSIHIYTDITTSQLKTT